MKAIHIDFAPRTLARAAILTPRRSRIVGLVGVVLSICAALVALNMLRHQSQRKLELDGLQSRLAERSGHRPAVKRLVVTEAQAGTVNKAIAQLNLPWRDLLDSIEASTPDSIALLALEPDAKNRSLKGMAEAKNSDDMIAYIESLKKQHFFDGVVLTRHEVNERDPNKPLRFQFEATWIETVR